MSAAPPDRIAAFLAERTPRRLIAIGLFVGGLLLFRSLLILLVFFVIFERGFEWLSTVLRNRLKLPRKAALAICFTTFLTIVGVLATVGIGRLVRLTLQLKETLPERIAAIKELPLYEKAREHIDDLDKIVEGARHYATSFLGYLSTAGHVALYALLGFILAIVFLLEKDTLRAFARQIPPTSLKGTLLRWVGHVADALFVTVQFQLVVAACNAVLTIPVLFLVGVPHIPSLSVLIFVSGLIPVVGNLVSGAILSLLAYQAKGWLGVGLFIGLTFVLHKLESYYLNPRLASRHVRLPGFVLIVSLICWEHLIGFVGLFVSFPFLFTTIRIAHELERENQGLPPVDESEPTVLGGTPPPAPSRSQLHPNTRPESGPESGPEAVAPAPGAAPPGSAASATPAAATTTGESSPI